MGGVAISGLWSSRRDEHFEDVGRYTPDKKPVGVFMLRMPSANVYVVDGVLIDGGAFWDYPTIRHALDELAGNPWATKTGALPLESHAITHAHPDHQGSSAALCRHYKLPFFCGAGDRGVAEGKESMAVGPPYHPIRLLPHDLWSGRRQRVERPLSDGEPLGRTGAVTVVETPGHTPGSVSFWVPASRVAIVGDVLANQPWLTVGDWSCPPCPREPPRRFCWSRADNRESLRKLFALGPRIVCFGHGPPLVLETTRLEDHLPAALSAEVVEPTIA